MASDAFHISRLQLAQHRVDDARRIVTRQRRTLAKLSQMNGYRQREAELLTAFERALVVFETDLTEINALES
jgi:hypothetical protein